MMTLDASASGGGVAGINGDLFNPPRSGFSGGRGSPTGYRGVMSGAGIGVARDVAHARDGAAARGSAASPRSGGRDGDRSSVVAGAAARLTEAWSLLEASEAARRRLQGEVKGWAERAAVLEEALAAAEASAEGRAREARLLAASLQDAKEGLEAEEAARREAEGRAEALRYSCSKY